MYEVETMKSNDQKNYGISAVKVMNGRAINDQFCIPGTEKVTLINFAFSISYLLLLLTKRREVKERAERVVANMMMEVIIQYCCN